MATLDTNQNGQIEVAEAEKAPGLACAFLRFDSDMNGSLTADEIAARVQSYEATQLGLMPFSCTISINGRLQEGLNVKLVPESFLASALAPAAAVTSTSGVAAPIVAGEQFPAVACGLYRVEVSWQEEGQELLPTQYNVQTRLGVEVAPDVPGLERGVHFDLERE